MPAEADIDREELLLNYLDQLPYEPYPIQEDALMRYFEEPTPGSGSGAINEGVLVCAPTGTGKTLIAEAALFEALHTGKTAYYTTPLIALTEQKFQEIQDAAEKWGFDRQQIGLVTGNRSVNPQATVLVVVAEILLNRLLHPDAFDFKDVSAVVMDEFHSFNEPERGIVWELSLALLPKHTRLMLLSATVGNANEFLNWLSQAHNRQLVLASSTERKVPLSYHWIEDETLQDTLVDMAKGDDEAKKTPALAFCFDREQCWNVAEMLRGRDLLSGDQQETIAEQIQDHDFEKGVGPRLKRLLLRGVGVHHAGLLPKHRRLVETLFQQKLLSICTCTETLAAGINLPARSVVLTNLLKGPRGKKKLIAPSQAQQIFGRAGRPQFDTQGHVYTVAHEDDVKIFKHKLKIEQIPEDTKDPKLMAMRKKLIKKGPKRSDTIQYWSEAQFEKLQTAAPGNLESKGSFPWRLMAFLLDANPEIAPLREAVRKRLMPEPRKKQAQTQLTNMLITLHEQRCVQLDPPPPTAPPAGQLPTQEPDRSAASTQSTEAQNPPTLLAGLSLGGPTVTPPKADIFNASAGKKKKAKAPEQPKAPDYEPVTATKADRLQTLLSFRAVQPMYGLFLTDYLGLANRAERLQIFESLMEVPGSIARRVRVPRWEYLPPASLQTDIVDPALIQAGLVTQGELYPPPPNEQDLAFGELPKFPINLGDKMYLLFKSKIKHGGDLRIMPVWIAGDLLTFEGDFYGYIQARDLAKQEGVIFRHILRLILLCEEFQQVTPDGIPSEEWVSELKELSAMLTETCRSVDPQSTDEVLAQGV